jgi:hypothetical protein
MFAAPHRVENRSQRGYEQVLSALFSQEAEPEVRLLSFSTKEIESS